MQSHRLGTPQSSLALCTKLVLRGGRQCRIAPCRRILSSLCMLVIGLFNTRSPFRAENRASGHDFGRILVGKARPSGRPSACRRTDFVGPRYNNPRGPTTMILELGQISLAHAGGIQPGRCQGRGRGRTPDGVGRILVRKARPSGRSSDGRSVDFVVFPAGLRPKSGPEALIRASPGPRYNPRGPTTMILELGQISLARAGGIRPSRCQGRGRGRPPDGVSRILFGKARLWDHLFVFW